MILHYDIVHADQENIGEIMVSGYISFFLSSKAMVIYGKYTVRAMCKMLRIKL